MLCIRCMSYIERDMRLVTEFFGPPTYIILLLFLMTIFQYSFRYRTLRKKKLSNRRVHHKHCMKIHCSIFLWYMYNITFYNGVMARKCILYRTLLALQIQRLSISFFKILKIPRKYGEVCNPLNYVRRYI